MMPDAIMLARQ